jgi:hypothetical protein
MNSRNNVNASEEGSLKCHSHRQCAPNGHSELEVTAEKGARAPRCTKGEST